MAHPIELVTRQRDDKAQPGHYSRFWSLISGRLRSACACGSLKLPQGSRGQMRGVGPPFIWP
ncbi:hypothetical protein FOXYSP1_20700 [Fusarium oxysporum f. sp. phaseoli]